ncbi:hypothetical protein I4F81_011378 [Pyropia yezoensis]|uniref:Uncharacterized protein n=1 Tax=Pyropia yezoensis TaxID=2788 RepID=A0ACC3CGJ0_PYRYE|nr:hypothetical protein I4F81_011378 [Neopyropia yezoensis]
MATFAADAGAATNPVAATSAAADPLALRVLLSPAEANVCALLAATAAQFSRQAGGGQAVTVRIVGGKAHPTVTLKVRGVHVDVTSLRGGRVEAQDGVSDALPASAAAADNHAAADAGAVAVTAAWAADAAARDLTLNALFVDPSTRVVTDPTRRGVAAAAARLAATAAPAAATLGADPRRALRVARLAAAARLAVDDAIPPAAAAVAAPSLAAIVAEGGEAAAAVAREVDALAAGGASTVSVGTWH